VRKDAGVDSPSNGVRLTKRSRVKYTSERRYVSWYC